MRKAFVYCDHCGRRQETKDNWSQHVISIDIHCPPGGINGGRFHGDLCDVCRAEMMSILFKFSRDGTLLADTEK